jgi:hypothetical protein
MALATGGLGDMYQQSGTSEPTTAMPPMVTNQQLATSANTALDPYRSLNWGQQYDFSNPQYSDLYGSAVNDPNTWGTVFNRNGFTGAAASPYEVMQTYGENGQEWATTQYKASQELQDWLSQNGYNLREANTQSGTMGENYYGLFKGDELMDAHSKGYSSSGTWIKPLITAFLGAVTGGAALSGLAGAGGTGLGAASGSGGAGLDALGAAAYGTGGATAGTSGSLAGLSNGMWDVSGLNDGVIGGDMWGAVGGQGGGGLEGMGAGGDGGQYVWNAAQDSQAANLGGTMTSPGMDPASVWGAAGNGMTGATVGAAPIPAANLGSLGGIMETGLGGAAAGAAGTQGNNPSAYLPPGAEMPTAQTPPPSTGLGSIPGLGSILSGLQGTLGQLANPTGLTAIMDLLNSNNQQNVWNNQMEALNQNFSPDSPYAKQMEETLARKDAAGGRNSQYGPRATNLAAMLTRDKANAVKDLMSMQGKALESQNASIGSLAGLMNQTGLFDDLSSGIQDLLGLLGD